jgi:hypothetical protein
LLKLLSLILAYISSFLPEINKPQEVEGLNSPFFYLVQKGPQHKKLAAKPNKYSKDQLSLSYLVMCISTISEVSILSERDYKEQNHSIMC